MTPLISSTNPLSRRFPQQTHRFPRHQWPELDWVCRGKIFSRTSFSKPSKSRKIIALFSFVKLFSVMAYMSGNYSCHPDNIHPASVSRIKIRVEKEQKTMRRLIDSYSADQKRLCPAQTTDKCRWIKKRSPRYIFTWWVGETNILLLQTMAFVHLQVNIIIIIIININIINSIVVFIIWSIVL